MSKEWLEDWLKDKKEQLKSATVFINENGNEAVEVSLSVLNKLFKQAERVQVLELEVNDWKDEVKKWQRFYEESVESHLETMALLRSTLNQNKRYRKALKFYADRNHYSDRLYDYKIVLLDDGEIARKALEE